MNTYTLTAKQAREYDESDEQATRLMDSLRKQYGAGGPAGGAPVALEVRHPDGYVIEQFRSAA